MKYFIKIAKGLAVTSIFLLLAVIFASVGKLLDLDSFVWPLYWPLALFMLPGMFAFPLMAILPDSINMFYLLFPEGGGSGVFGSMLLTAFVLWVLLFSSVDAFGKIITLTRNRNRTGESPADL